MSFSAVELLIERYQGSGKRRGNLLCSGFPEAGNKSLLNTDFAKFPYELARANVLVIGGGDTGNDCGNIHPSEAKSVTQLEMMPARPPAAELPSIHGRVAEGPESRLRPGRRLLQYSAMILGSIRQPLPSFIKDKKEMSARPRS